MDDFSSISLLSLAMLVGCYVAGTIPLAVNFSEVSLNPSRHVYSKLVSLGQVLHVQCEPRGVYLSAEDNVFANADIYNVQY